MDLWEILGLIKTPFGCEKFWLYSSFQQFILNGWLIWWWCKKEQKRFILPSNLEMFFLIRICWDRPFLANSKMTLKNDKFWVRYLFLFFHLLCWEVSKKFRTFSIEFLTDFLHRVKWFILLLLLISAIFCAAVADLLLRWCIFCAAVFGVHHRWRLRRSWSILQNGRQKRHRCLKLDLFLW